MCEINKHSQKHREPIFLFTSVDCFLQICEEGFSQWEKIGFCDELVELAVHYWGYWYPELVVLERIEHGWDAEGFWAMDMPVAFDNAGCGEEIEGLFYQGIVASSLISISLKEDFARDVVCTG